MTLPGVFPAFTLPVAGGVVVVDSFTATIEELDIFTATVETRGEFIATLSILDELGVETTMAATVSSCGVSQIDVCRKRGDVGKVLRFYLTQPDGTDLATGTLTGATSLLTIDPASDPSDDTTQVGQLTGSITQDQTGNPTGQQNYVEFTITSAVSLLAPDTYFYDAQVTLSSGTVDTFAEGSWTQEADITNAGS